MGGGSGATTSDCPLERFCSSASWGGMARIDDLITQITDKQLRQRLEAALSDMKRHQRFGLVFEEHIPETTTLLHFPVQVGASVQKKSDKDGKQLYQVKAVTSKGRAKIEPEGGDAEETVATTELMAVKRFGDPIFPAAHVSGIH